jgi:outer membrane protein assembly factor BamC
LRPSRFLGGLPVLPIALLVMVGLVGCSSQFVQDILPDHTLAYKKSREAGENLELPPDLKGGTFDDALDVPPIEGGATFSDYAGGRAQRLPTAGSSTEVLPAVTSVDLQRDGKNRWLEVQATPQQVWPRVVSFWREQGILLVEQNPAVGVMKTDWIENRAEIRQDFVTRMMSKVAAGLYSASTRDQFSIRIDSGAKSGTTEVHLTHRGMEEKVVSNTVGESGRTIWEPSGNDSEKEAEMLRRLMIYLGASQQKASAALAASARGGTGPASAPVAGAATAGASSTATPSTARLVNEGGAQVLVIGDELRRGWRMTGSALDRAGFAVEDRDISRGVYYVRYQDTDAAAQGNKKGWMSRLAFWRGNDIDKVKQYQIRVEGNDRETRVTVLDPKGQRDTSVSAGQILALLQEQMN